MFYIVDDYGVKFSEDKSKLIQAPYELSGKYIIPDTVKVISNGAFTSCKELKEIVIPESVTTIEDRAFSRCTKLTTAFIPNSVNYLGICIFEECKSLTDYSLPSNLRTIPNGMFAKCSMLETVVIPNTIEIIEGGAFNGCSQLHTVIIGDNLKEICEYAFAHCTNLRFFRFGKNIDNIETYAFYDCNKLNTIEWDVENYRDCIYEESPFGHKEKDRYYDCYYYKIEHVIFGDHVKHIPANLCRYFHLQEIDIPNNVESIGPLAFDGCSPRYVYFNQNITLEQYRLIFGIDSEDYAPNVFDCYFEKDIFYPLQNVEEFAVSLKNNDFSSRNGCLYNKDGTILYKLGRKYSGASFQAIKEIAPYACCCSDIDSVYLDDVCEKIGDFAFKNCENLERIKFGEKFKQHGNFSFIGCNNLHEIIWNAEEGNLNLSQSKEFWVRCGSDMCKYEDIKYDIYKNIDTIILGDNLITLPKFLPQLIAVRELNIPNNVKYLCEYLPPVLTKLTIANEMIENFDDDNDKDFCYENGFIYNSDKTILQKYIGQEKKVILPEGIEKLANYAFQYSEIEKVTFPHSLKAVGNYCFYNSKVVSVIINEELNEIGYSAFENCCALKKINIPLSVSDISYNIINNCESLEEITLGKNNKGISLNGCESLTKIIWADFSENVDDVDEYSFDDDSYNIKEIEILNGVQYIPVNFAAHTLIEKIHLPSTIKKIGHKAFYNCEFLKIIEIESMEIEIEEDFCNFGQRFVFNEDDNSRYYISTKIICNDTDVTEYFIKINKQLKEERIAAQREQAFFDDWVRDGIETAFEGDPEAIGGIWD